MTRIAAGTVVPTNITNEGITTFPDKTASEANGVSARPRAPASESGVDRPPPQLGNAPRGAAIGVASLRNDILGWEGRKAFMYADTRGYVTTGIGNKLSTPQEAMALPWRHQATGLPATGAEIRAAFDRVQAKFAEFRLGHPDPKQSAGAGHYEHATDLVLPTGKIEELADSRIEGFLKSLRGLFPGFDAYPAPAQRALVDMVYTLGAKGLERKFPTVVASCRAGDFTTAAQFCHRKAQANENRKGDARNVLTKNQFLEAARLAADVQTLKREIRL